MTHFLKLYFLPYSLHTISVYLFYELQIFSLNPRQTCKLYFNLFSYILSVFFVTVKWPTITG